MQPVEPSELDRATAIAQSDPSALITVVGPTGSGKTGLASALAARVGGEVVSCDSVQIYREFDIGSGKPSPEEFARAPHHLIGAVDPLEPVDAARFAAMAERAISDIVARGKRPIVCGGTFLWVKALLFGLAEAPGADAEIRARHRAFAEASGRAALHARLEAVDPMTASRLHPNDLLRVSRALEVHELTGRTMSAWQEAHAFSTVRHRAKLLGLGLARDPAALTVRIEQRVQAMFDAGFIDETRSLLARGYADARAMSSVGYREVSMHLRGEIDAKELPGAVVRSTRVFARRQRTWLRTLDVTWL